VFENRVLRRLFAPKRDEVRGNGENYIMRNLCSVLLTPYSVGDKREKNEMGEACSMNGGKGRGVYRVLVGKPEGRRPLGRPRLDGRIILRWIFRKWVVGV
jgi:hypothetical protein